jgi:osmotically-inducible protein OsmY
MRTPKANQPKEVLVRTPSAFVLGAVTAFFLDPRLGKSRRRVFRDRSLRALRRAGRFLVGKLKFFGGHARGVAAEARSAVVTPDAPTDDATVKQRIMSDAFRGIPSAGDLEVDVENGIARVAGTVPSQSLADDLVSRVRKVPGVRGVAPQLTVGAAGSSS